MLLLASQMYSNNNSRHRPRRRWCFYLSFLSLCTGSSLEFALSIVFFFVLWLCVHDNHFSRLVFIKRLGRPEGTMKNKTFFVCVFVFVCDRELSCSPFFVCSTIEPSVPLTCLTRKLNHLDFVCKMNLINLFINHFHPRKKRILGRLMTRLYSEAKDAPVNPYLNLMRQ